MTSGPDYAVTALAYLGDAVIELEVRERLVKKGFASSADLNREALRYVTARAQSEAVAAILPLLTPEEEQIWRRGRNSTHLKNAPPSATVAEYSRASGMETLFGWLELGEKKDRIRELTDAAYPDLKKV